MGQSKQHYILQMLPGNWCWSIAPRLLNITLLNLGPSSLTINPQTPPFLEPTLYFLPSLISKLSLKLAISEQNNYLLGAFHVRSTSKFNIVCFDWDQILDFFCIMHSFVSHFIHITPGCLIVNLFTSFLGICYIFTHHDLAMVHTL